MRLLGVLVVVFAADAARAVPSPETAAMVAQSQSTQSEDARRDAIAAQALRGDEASCRALVAALTDPEEDLRNRAAQALYDKCQRSAAVKEAGPALRKSIALGTTTAGAFLLLGRTADADTVAALGRLPPRLIRSSCSHG